MAAITGSRPASAEGLLQRRCQELVSAELARLSRRLPGLPGECLGQVEAALGRVVERLVLSRAGDISSDALSALFDLTGAR